MNLILRGIRVIDPLAHLDATGQDVWLSEGQIVAIDGRISSATVPVIDLTPESGKPPCVLCPGFIDLHAHLREPGPAGVETIASGSRAAAAGGFTQVVTMANTLPVIDSAELVSEARSLAVGTPVQVLTAAAMTRGLAGTELVDIPGCARAGAVAFSDDGRNAAAPPLLARALRAAADAGRPVLIHPENEEMIARRDRTGEAALTRCSERPPEVEATAVELGLRALGHAGRGRLHLQHLSAVASVNLLQQARDRGAAVTAEVTPHHLAMWLPLKQEPHPPSLRKVNPPLRSEADREAVVQALRDGVIDAVATDHAPHPAAAKTDDYDASAPGMIGLETALATCLTLGGMDDVWLPVLVERLTAGPWRVLGDAAGVPEPRLRLGEAANCVLFDPAAEWAVGEVSSHSLSGNTPLRGMRLRGRVLLTLVNGAVAHHDGDRLHWLDIGSPSSEVASV